MKKIITVIIAAAAAFCAAVSCGPAVKITMSQEEADLINNSPEVMRILTTDNPDDLAVLRAGTRNFNVMDLNTAEYAKFADKLVKTLQSCDGGVGLAAPQVGISRRVVAVMRVDKEGSPIEVYPNIRIEEMRGEMEPGGEGCLSVPDKRGDVLRYQDITIVYTDINSDRADQPREIRENISGFAAVIFQHEADHLDGILFTDKLQ